jgi:hypothetical protein
MVEEGRSWMVDMLVEVFDGLGWACLKRRVIVSCCVTTLGVVGSGGIAKWVYYNCSFARRVAVGLQL